MLKHIDTDQFILTDCKLEAEHFADNQFADRSFAVILSAKWPVSELSCQKSLKAMPHCLTLSAYNVGRYFDIILLADKRCVFFHYHSKQHKTYEQNNLLIHLVFGVKTMSVLLVDCQKWQLPMSGCVVQPFTDYTHLSLPRQTKTTTANVRLCAAALHY